MSLNTIREVTKITGITANALRYYDTKGILHPTERNTEGRKEWLYDDEAVRRAKRILLLRRIGIPVESIASALDDASDTGSVDKAILRSRLDELQEERSSIDEQISVARVLILLEDVSAEADVKGDLVDKMFEKVCLDE
jgi:DNA-binding transcriptional MerR regulator